MPCYCRRPVPSIYWWRLPTHADLLYYQQPNSHSCCQHNLLRRTFYVCPSLFQQLYTVNAVADGSIYPLGFALLQGRTKSSTNVSSARSDTSLKTPASTQTRHCIRQQLTTQRPPSSLRLPLKAASSTTKRTTTSPSLYDEQQSYYSYHNTYLKTYDSTHLETSEKLTTYPIQHHSPTMWQSFGLKDALSYGHTIRPKDPAPPSTWKAGTIRSRRKFSMPIQTSTRL